MDFRKGDRVRHPTKAEWGLGEVLEDSGGSALRVFFAEAGKKTLSLQHVVLERVPPELASDPVLDKLQLHTESSVKYQSLTESKKYFLERFPEGFSDSSYLEQERDYKVRAHQLGRELLSEPDLNKLFSESAYGEVCKRSLRVLNATNLVFPNEKMSFKDGLATAAAQERFAKSLRQVLYSKDLLKQRFQRFASVLEEIDAAKWTTASYFLFIIEPAKYMFVKPTVTRHAAELCRFPINYNSKLNWVTYKGVLDFSAYLDEQLDDLGPRDMIDIQSFMWCITPRV